MNKYYLLLLPFFSTLNCLASNPTEVFSFPTDTNSICDSLYTTDSIAEKVTQIIPEINNVSSDSLNHSQLRSKKIIAAILSFPVPFGLLGLHRLFLGTKPYIPFVYIGTLGGCFLILPILDFVAIISSKAEDFKQFENNPKVFMWAH